MKKRKPLITAIKILTAAGLLGGLYAVLLHIDTNSQQPQHPVFSSAETIGQKSSIPSNEAVASVINETPIGTAQYIQKNKAQEPNTIVLPIDAVFQNVNTPVADWREFKPTSLVITPRQDNIAITFNMVDFREENDRTIWLGRNEGIKGAFLTSVATADNWHGILEVPGYGSFRLHASNNMMKVAEQREAVACARPTQVTNPYTQYNQFTGKRAAIPTTSEGSIESVDATNVTVDVLFFYDEMVADENTREDIVSDLMLQLEASNAILVNSAITNFKWKYISAYEAPSYAATQDMEDDLNKMSDSSTTLGAFVYEKRRIHIADQCVLYVGGSRGNTAGIAWMPCSV